MEMIVTKKGWEVGFWRCSLMTKETKNIKRRVRSRRCERSSNIFLMESFKKFFNFIITVLKNDWNSINPPFIFRHMDGLNDFILGFSAKTNGKFRHPQMEEQKHKINEKWDVAGFPPQCPPKAKTWQKSKGEEGPVRLECFNAFL